jgi:hypothetical protein
VGMKEEIEHKKIVLDGEDTMGDNVEESEALSIVSIPSSEEVCRQSNSRSENTLKEIQERKSCKVFGSAD